MLQIGKDPETPLKIKSKACGLPVVQCKHAFAEVFGRKQKTPTVEEEEEEEVTQDKTFTGDSNDEAPTVDPKIDLQYFPNDAYPINIPIRAPSAYLAVSTSKYVCFTEAFDCSSFDKVSAALEEALGHVSQLCMLKAWMVHDQEDSLRFDGSSV